jgi:hypothetical protein
LSLQVVLSSDTLAALTGNGSSIQGAVIHLGAHLLEDNAAAHQQMCTSLIYGLGDTSRHTLKGEMHSLKREMNNDGSPRSPAGM